MSRQSPHLIQEADWHPTLLRTPGRWGFPIERILPGRPQDYIVTEPLPKWKVVLAPCWGVVYMGSGAVSVIRSPAPF